MDTAPLLTQLHAEVELFGQLVTAALPDVAHSPVPGCEGMDLAELVRHVGSVHRLVADWVRDGRRPNAWAQAPVGGEDLVGWSRRGSADMLETLSSRSPEQPCATWSATDQSVGFWIRRMAHETAVHRVDVAQTYGERWTVEPELAADGVAEAFELWLGTRLGTQVGGFGQATRLMTIPGAGGPVVDWTIRPLKTIVEFRTGPGGADATVTGTPAALWAWTCGRTDLDHRVDTVGNPEAAGELRALLGRAQQ